MATVLNERWVWLVQGRRESLVRGDDAHELILDGSCTYQGERVDGRAVIVAINGKQWQKTTRVHCGAKVGMAGMELVG